MGRGAPERARRAAALLDDAEPLGERPCRRRGDARAAVFEDLAEGDAQQPRGRIAALAVAIEPEQVLGRARRQRRVAADQVGDVTVVDRSENSALTGPSERTQVSFERPPRCIAMTGDVSSPATRVRPPGSTRQPHGVGTANTRNMSERGERSRRSLEHRRLRDRDHSWTVCSAAHDAPGASLARPARELADHDARRAAPLYGLMTPVGPAAAVVDGRPLAAPPGGQRGQLELLAQQVARGAAESPAARSIPGRPTRARWRPARCRGGRSGPGKPSAESERSSSGSQELVVQALQDAVHGLRPLRCLQVDAVVAHREVAAFDQREAEIARQVGVLEVGLVVRAGREQHDPRRPSPRGAQWRSDVRTARGRTPPGAAPAARGTSAGRRARRRAGSPAGSPGPKAPACGRHHPPVAIGRARQVEAAMCRCRPPAGFSPAAGAGSRDGRRPPAAASRRSCSSVCGAVDVAEDAVEQLGALQDAGLDLLPFVGREHQREQIERPGPLLALGVGIDVVGDAVVADLALGAAAACRSTSRSLRSASARTNASQCGRGRPARASSSSKRSSGAA